MNKAAFCRAFAGLSSMALLTLLSCPFAARADAADTAVPADVIFPEPCHTNAECVPASCCHASICVSRRERPHCTGVLCTLVCEPGTMDCGQGYCACRRGGCVAVIRGGM